MASQPTFTFRRGYGEYVKVSTPASTMINPGDLIFSNVGVATPASAFVWDTNLATTQTSFRLLFLGVAMDQKLASDASTREILVCTRGVFQYPCAALGAALHIGAFVGPAKDTGNALLDQTLANAATAVLSVGTVNEEAATGATSLLVYLQSYLVYSAQ